MLEHSSLELSVTTRVAADLQSDHLGARRHLSVGAGSGYGRIES